MRQLIHWFAILTLFIGIYVGIFYYNGNFHVYTNVDRIKEHGYDFEIHSNITTPDGYILEMYRLKNNESTFNNKTPVFVMHGLLSSSYCFLVNNNSLGYVLADNGYDVWLGNARGTIYSRRHVNLTEDDRKFWDFSWHEIGLYDVKTFIEYIVNKTGHEKIYYIGHSQGTTVYYVLTSHYPEINERIKHMIALAPIIYFDHMPNWLVSLGTYLQNFLEPILTFVGFNAVAPDKSTISFGSELLCNSTLMTPICWILLQINDYDFTTFHNRIDLNYVNYVEAITQGCSARQFYHYGQLINSDDFCEYDFGKEINLIKYNSINPPRYNIERFNTTMSVYHSTMDHYAIDLKRLKSTFKNITRIKEIPFKHLDFVAGKDTTSLYEDIIEDLMIHEYT